MFKFPLEVVVTGRGAWGPFKDAIGTEREGRTYPYVTLASPTEGGNMNATLAEGVDPDSLPGIMERGTLLVELYERDRGQLKLRVHGRADAHEHGIRAAA